MVEDNGVTAQPTGLSLAAASRSLDPGDRATPEERENAEALLRIYEDGHHEGWNEAIERVALWHEEKATLLGAHDDIEWRVASDQHTRMAAMFRDWKPAPPLKTTGAR